MKKALTIAGSDCSGGAGIQADLKTFSAHGVFGMSVVTSVVAENTVRVISYQDMTPQIIQEQIDAVFEDITPDAVKIGMLSTVETMRAVAVSLKKWQPEKVVLDPVMYAKNGCALMDPSSIDTLIEEVLPLATLITPNVPEAEKISGLSIHSLEDMRTAAKKIYNLCGAATLVKGGHKVGKATDVLYDGQDFSEYTSERIDTKNTHGTGCTFSSAIASQLALGKEMDQAVDQAKKYVTTAIRHSLSLGNGHGPTNHFYDLYQHGLKE
ncbi:bifunctional hydroxymethylpyrimidine kinase/phosphomethylpyrimidine kinase [Enterococcus pallens]|uniref:Hydroxymethylpyrimidine/phosphomethylpyrimidine kinase n=1 Tax=Enterococcus pallens ATCC BAA-351 TaxID=1158607 RepID=R2T249_9ENTE|nr:bifunctional hydroxymethylpyrimidine kinase/phosphomethylpyrimidine kinase [Enterococcus pallens]EOH94334.1 phosphomethylpyrimidine kinase [Enterococcus pallens ATCC BAA-351]EOU24213.1 phosphomethylpyrimidine kinase [Enterococcus pallens ATCC BAA-351]OJG82009.1 phosphomethylpyrimidine kinase [Enterococcus pallens]